MNETIDAIIEASDSTFSIIIIGIGDADFSEMNALDADDKSLCSSRGKTKKRNIVQFHQFSERDYRDLTAEVLAKIPRQVHEFHKSKGINLSCSGY
jgi:hypothetical protein